MAYKGYLIKVNPFNGFCYISKEGYHISTALDVQHAKDIIDQLTH
jgi:hypothetical protein